MPAITRWSRRSEWSRRDSFAQISASASTPSPSASGPRCATSACAASGLSSHTPARFFDPASVSTSSRAALERDLECGRLRPLLAGEQVLEPTRGHQVHEQHELAVVRREEQPFRAPLGARDRRPSSVESGGSNVLSVATWAGPAFSIGKAETGSFELAPQCLHLRKLGHAPSVLRRAEDGSGCNSADVSDGTCESSTGSEASEAPTAPTQIAPGSRSSTRARRRGASQRDHAPHDHAHDRVRPPEQAVRRDRLHEGPDRDVEDDAAEARDRERRDEQGHRLRLRRERNEEDDWRRTAPPRPRSSVRVRARPRSAATAKAPARTPRLPSAKHEPDRRRVHLEHADAVERGAAAPRSRSRRSSKRPSSP